jgi:hypothetical protein
MLQCVWVEGFTSGTRVTFSLPFLSCASNKSNPPLFPVVPRRNLQEEMSSDIFQAAQRICCASG